MKEIIIAALDTNNFKSIPVESVRHVFKVELAGDFNYGLIKAMSALGHRIFEKVF